MERYDLYKRRRDRGGESAGRKAATGDRGGWKGCTKGDPYSDIEETEENPCSRPKRYREKPSMAGTELDLS